MQENILIDKSGNARITDFGRARISRDANLPENADDELGHASQWTAPEVWSGSPVTKESDIFSFGMVIIEVGGDKSVICRPTYPLF